MSRAAKTESLDGSRPRRATARSPSASSPERARIAALSARQHELEDEIRDLRAELERSERRVEAMKQIGRALGSNLELDPLLAEIVARTTDLLEAERSTLFLVDAEKRELWSKVLEGKGLREIRLPHGVGVAGWVAKFGRPVHLRDAYDDPRFNPEFDRRSGFTTRCMLAWPVRRPHGEVIGVIQVLNKRRGAFDGTDERLMEAIASEIGVALEVSRLYREAVERSEALERARRELVLLFETERAISKRGALSEMLDAILGTALSSLDARSAVIHLLDENGLHIELTAAAGAHAASLERALARAGDPIVGKVLTSGEPFVKNDGRPALRGRVAARNLAAVPIHTKYTGIIGVFELINKKARSGFTEEDVRALLVVAAQAGRAISAERRRKTRERSERLATIGHMLSGLVHDLRTPLTLISGYADLMAVTDRPSDRREHNAHILKQIDIVSSMTKDLLAFARGERTILIRKVYVETFLEDIRRSLEKELEGSGVELIVDLRYRGAARFDETKLRRVFHNIARNARDAMPGGGRFTITVSKVGDELVLAFSDTGTGIPREVADKIFEPFATAGKAGGTGLGLAMVKQIADEHGGSVSYVSAPKRGTTFTFRLPLE